MRFSKSFVSSALGLVATIGITSIAVADDLKVWREKNPRAVMVQNIGGGAVTINKIVVNDRPECRGWPFDPVAVASGKDFEGKGPMPHTLQIGDKVTIAASCDVVRARFDTDKGSFTYSSE
jgi:hypothetical protein